MAVDQAVWNFGTALQAQLHEAESKVKGDSAKKKARQRVFDRWFPGAKADTFRDPAAQPSEGLRR